MVVADSSPSWTDITTALATVVLAIFAIVSALFAARLWIEARKQFDENRRSTDMDIALRMLALSDDSEVREGEAAVMALYKEGKLANLDVFLAWRNNLESESRLKLFHHVSAVTTTYEHIGIIVRHTPAIKDIVLDYLCGRAPALFRVLKPLIEEDRTKGSAEISIEFERLANDCTEYARLHYPTIFARLRLLT